MDINVSEKDGVTILTLEGKIMGSPQETTLIDTLHKLAEEDKIKVVMDLEKVTWMNSSGLGMCINGMTTMRNRGGDLKLAAVTKNIGSLIEKCHLNKVFNIFETVDQAVASFK